MKRWRWLVAVAMTGVAVLAPAAAANGDLNVVVTIKPIHSLVTRLMEGVGTPALLVDGAASPHAFALKPSGARAINAADVFIRVAETVEPFTRRIVKALPQSVEVVTLEETPGLKLRRLRTSGTFERHDHDGVEEGRVSRGDTDGHVWLDPDNAKAIVAHLADVLSRRAPAHAHTIRANAGRLSADIDALTAAIERETGPLRDKPFVVFHDAYQYFEKRFGLDAVGSITMSPQVQPSARRLTELRRKIRSLEAVCVFAEPSFQPNLIAAVTEGTRARAGTLDPIGTMLEPGPELYFTLMRNLADGLSLCLRQGS